MTVVRPVMMTSSLPGSTAQQGLPEWEFEHEFPQRGPLARLHEEKLRRVAAGSDVIDLSMVNPDLPPPRVLVDRLMEASGKPFNHRYSVSRGIRKLREAFARRYQWAFGVTLDPEHQVCVTMGTKDAIQHALRVLTVPGDRVLVPSPTYPAHTAAIRLQHLEVVPFECHQDDERTLAELEATLERTAARVVLLNFPNNPTSRSVGESFYRGLACIAARHQVAVVNDFVYGELLFGERAAVSALHVAELRPYTLESYSLSKAYNVPGWRLGALVGAPDLISRVSRVKSQLDYGVFLPLQMAAAAVIGQEQDLAAATRDAYHARTKILAHGLKRLGWQLTVPTAGACVWAEPPVSLFSGMRGEQIAHALLERAGVLALPGTLFGERFERHLRFAAVAPEQMLHEVVARIEQSYGSLTAVNEPLEVEGL